MFADNQRKEPCFQSTVISGDLWIIWKSMFCNHAIDMYTIVWIQPILLSKQLYRKKRSLSFVTVYGTGKDGSEMVDCFSVNVLHLKFTF